MAMVSGMLSSVVDIWTAFRLCFSHNGSEDDAPETLYMNNQLSSAFTASDHPVPYLGFGDHTVHTSNLCHIVSEDDTTTHNIETKYYSSRDMMPDSAMELQDLPKVVNIELVDASTLQGACKEDPWDHQHFQHHVTRVHASRPSRRLQPLRGSNPHHGLQTFRKKEPRPLLPLPPLPARAIESELAATQDLDTFFLFIVHKAFLFVERLPDFPSDGYVTVVTALGRSSLRILKSAGRQGVYRMLYVSEEGLMVTTLRGKVGLIAIDERLRGTFPSQQMLSTEHDQVLSTRVPADQQFLATLCFPGIFLPDSCIALRLPPPHIITD